MTLRMRVLPRFPAKISSGAGIKISRPDGSADITVSIDFSSIIRVPSVQDGNKVFFLTWNSDLDTYSIMSFTDTFQAVIDTTGLMLQSIYDPTSIEADVFNRANHYGTNTPTDGTVTTAKIVDGALTTPKLADQSVTPAKLSAALSATIAGKMNGPSSLTAPTLIGRLTGSGDAVSLTKAESRQLIGGFEPIGDPVNLAGVSQVDWTNLSAFRHLILKFSGRANLSANIGGLHTRVSTDNGATFLSGSTDYNYGGLAQEQTAVSGSAIANSSLTLMAIEPILAGSSFHGNFQVSGFNLARSTLWSSECHNVRASTSTLRVDINHGGISSATPRNALRFFCGESTFADGIAELFGLRA